MKTFDEIRGLCNEGTVNEISKDMKGRYIKKAADDMAKSADKMARQTRKDDPKVMGRASARFVKRRKGIARAVEDSTDDAVKAFLKKGGKIKKLAPGKAAGYHGKDDPGADVHGMMDRGDTKAVGTRKKVKSMEGKEVKEISKKTLGTYVKKAVSDVDDKSYTQGQHDASGTDSNYNRTLNKRRRGINKALNRLMK